MHRFWTIPELVDHVCEESDYQTLLVMARVRRSFWAHAMRLVWSYQPRLSYLLRLLPEERQDVFDDFEPECYEYVGITGDLLASDCTRLHLYAPFVKTISVILQERNYKDLLQLYMHSNGQPLLPQLRDLDITSPELESISNNECQQILELLLGSSVESISWRHTGGSELMATSFFTRLQAIPRLRYLQWEADTFPKEADESLYSFLPNASHLQTFDISAAILPPAILESASDALNLRTASFSGLRETGSTNTPPSTFPSLEKLFCSGSSVGLTAALQQISAPQLTVLLINWYNSGSGIIGPLKGSQPFPVLTFLQMSIGRVSEDDLQTIFLWKNLKILRLLPNSTSAEPSFWPARTVFRLAQSLPKLEVLNLGDGYGCPVDEAMSLPELECFARHCPNLRALYVGTDARGLNSFNRPLIPHPAVQKVGIDESTIDEHKSDVARVIHQLWPDLTRDFLASRARDSEDPELEQEPSVWPSIWEEVAELGNVDLGSDETKYVEKTDNSHFKWLWDLIGD